MKEVSVRAFMAEHDALDDAAPGKHYRRMYLSLLQRTRFPSLSLDQHSEAYVSVYAGGQYVKRSTKDLAAEVMALANDGTRRLEIRRLQSRYDLSSATIDQVMLWEGVDLPELREGRPHDQGCIISTLRDSE